MPEWVLKAATLVAVIVVFAGVALLREGSRAASLKEAVARHGLLFHSPYLPAEHPPMVSLAKALDGRSAFLWSPRWGAGMTGVVDGRAVTIAEHEVPALTMNHSTPKWHSMLVWPVEGNEEATDALVAGFRARQPEAHLTRDGTWAALRLEGKLDPARIDSLLTLWRAVARLPAPPSPSD